MNIGENKDIFMGIEKLGITAGKEIAAWVKTGGKLLTAKPAKINIAEIKYAPNSMSFQKSMNYDDALKMAKNYKDKTFSFADRTVNVSIGGNNYVGTWLGGGGSKCAYRVNYNGEDICLLLPHKAWGEALKEAKNTQILKQMGFLTNDYCKIVPVKIGDSLLPAMVSKPYDKHAFKIFDKKNPNDFIDKHINIDELNETNAMSFFSELIEDCKKCAKNKLSLGSDSYNIALVNGKPRLYFNDLPYDSSEMFMGNNYDKTLKYTLEEALSGLCGAFSYNAEKANPFVKKLYSLDFQDKFIEKILSGK